MWYGRLDSRQGTKRFLIPLKGGATLFSWRTKLAFLVSASLIAAPVFASHVHRSPTAGPATTSHKVRKVTKKAPKLHGQQAIDPERATQIQQALIREHYLTGDATGKWDDTTVAAMQKFQADQGWQTKLTPDSRALMKLGLGPDYSNAINARNSTFAAPPAAASSAPGEPAMSSSHPPAQTAGFAAAAGVSQ